MRILKLFSRHQHEWNEIAREKMYQQTLSPLILGAHPIGEPTPITIITRKCDTCPEYSQKILQGWL